MGSSAPIALKAALGLLMVDAILELSFISSMVAWLHHTATGTFPIVAIAGPGGATPPGRVTFDLQGEPASLMTDQGHTSNGAAGTAFVLLGVGGIIALFLRGRDGYHRSAFSRFFYTTWVALHIPALLLTLGALAYVFAVTRARAGQSIDLDVALRLAPGEKYPLLSWTPQNWFDALLRLGVAEGSVRDDVQSHYRVMLAWQYNLIPLFVVQLVETGLVLVDFLRRRKEVAYGGMKHEQLMKG